MLRLTELDRLKDEFISTVTHELRTPLTSIRAFSEILRDHPDLAAEKRMEYLDIVIRESERLTRLINDVLDLAKIEAGRADWHAEALDLRQVIEDAVQATSQLFKDRRIRRGTRLAGAGAAGNGGPRPPDAGDAESAVECGEILRCRRRAGSASGW